MASMLDSMQNKLTDSLGLTDTQQANRNLLYSQYEKPYQSANYGESALDPVDKLTNKPAAGATSALGVEDINAQNAQAKETFKPGEEKRANWKEYIPDATWDAPASIAPPPATRAGGGRGFNPGKGQEYYNFGGTVTNMTDPLNSQLSQRVMGNRKQLLGL